MHHQYRHNEVGTIGLDRVLVQRDASLIAVVDPLGAIIVEPQGDAELEVLVASKHPEISVDELAAHIVGAPRLMERGEAFTNEEAPTARGHSAQVAKDRLRFAE